jgi:TM2 domain-containing membrane protein YozV
LAKSLTLTMVLSFLVSGTGHIYLGFIKRGIIILLVGIGLSFGPELFLPWYFAFPPLYAYKIWQLMDAYKYQQIRNGNIPVTKTVT